MKNKIILQKKFDKESRFDCRLFTFAHFDQKLDYPQQLNLIFFISARHIFLPDLMSMIIFYIFNFFENNERSKRLFLYIKNTTFYWDNPRRLVWLRAHAYGINSLFVSYQSQKRFPYLSSCLLCVYVLCIMLDSQNKVYLVMWVIYQFLNIYTWTIG